MAVDLFSDSSSSRGVSPRISFSHDFCQSDGVPIEQYIRTTSSSSIDFDFCVFRGSFDQESSSADELFSNGKILPIEVKRKLGSIPPKKSSLSVEPPKYQQIPESSIHVNSEHNAVKSSQNDQSPSKKSGGQSSESEEKPSKNSFWRFKRSYSVNCGSGYGRTLCPLPLLSRSNSTGSTPNVKRSSSRKDNNFSNNKQHVTKPPLITSLKQSQSASSTAGNHPKPPLKKCHGSSYGNGVKVIPLLNVPSPSMFGLGSIFSVGKDKMKKK